MGRLIRISALLAGLVAGVVLVAARRLPSPRDAASARECHDREEEQSVDTHTGAECAAARRPLARAEGRRTLRDRISPLPR